MLRRLLSVLIVIPLLVLAACSGRSPAPEPTEQTPMSESPGAVTLPDTPAGNAAQWVLDTLAADSGPTAEEAEQHFAPVFLEQLPPAQIESVFDQLRALGPFTVSRWQGGDRAGIARLSSPGEQLEMQLALDAEGLIESLLFVPAEDAPQVTSYAEARDALVDRAQYSAFLVADETCTPLEAHDPDTALPIGSMFKLYVLGAVVTAVEHGTLSWDEELTLTEELKSLPSGTLQDEPAGTTVSVREAAGMMISISDNTATDLLIHRVGRDAVEAEVAAMGHHEPELVKPFLTTREAFQLAGSDPDLRERWAATTPSATDPSPEVTAAQREIVESLPDWDRELDEALVSSPFWLDGLDWFATAADLCRAHLNLQERAGTDAGEPVRAILAENPGVQVEADYLGFKGGSSVGELGLSFWLERGDTTRMAVLLTAADSPTGLPPENWTAGLAEQVLALE